MMKHFKKLKRRSGQSGFTLVEVLISVVVLSIGLLGLAGLQTMAIKFDHEAYLRTQVAYLADDMAARMRANRSQAAAYIGNITTTPPAACETAAGCTPAQMADYDTAKWQALITELLPQGTGMVSQTAAPLYQVTIGWYERSEQTANTKTYTLEVYP